MWKGASGRVSGSTGYISPLTRSLFKDAKIILGKIIALGKRKGAIYMAGKSIPKN